jgi:hypothetical protein
VETIERILEECDEDPKFFNMSLNSNFIKKLNLRCYIFNSEKSRSRRTIIISYNNKIN